MALVGISVALNVILAIVLIFCVWLVIKPNFFINNLNKVFEQYSLDEFEIMKIDPNLEEIEFSYNKTNYTFYRMIQSPSSAKVVIDVPGGAFVSAVPNYRPFKSFKQKFNVYFLTYPTIQTDTIKHITSFIKDAIHFCIEDFKKIIKKEFTISITSFSAGSFFIAQILSHANIIDNLTHVVFINGYFGQKTISNLILRTLEKLWLTSFYKISDYECKLLPVNIKYMFITSKEDFLQESTFNYAKTNQHPVKIYEGSHHFYFNSSLDAKTAYVDVENFLS